jgi:hypothetical protein
MSGVNTAGTKGVPRATREAQILDITAENIGRLGYAGLSVGEVAARAGVSKPLVYGYFGSKDSLYVACVQRAASVLGQAIDEAISGPANLQMAQRALEAVLAALQGRPHDWNVLFDRSHPVSGPGRRCPAAGTTPYQRTDRAGGGGAGCWWSSTSNHEYGNIIGDVRGARRLRNKLGYIFASPGWQPKDLAHQPASKSETLAAVGA